MKKNLFAFASTLAVICASHAQQPVFTPGRLAVLRVGDGLPQKTGIYNPISDWNLKQNPIFIDEFNPNLANATTPTYSVAIATNGANALFLNGNSGTEGGMSRAGDGSILALTGYAGNVLSIPGTPSAVPYNRGIVTVDPFGASNNVLPSAYGANWYGIATGKTNPRGVTTDGNGGYWGSGNPATAGGGVSGTLYYNPGFNDGYPTALQNVTATRLIKIINGTLYTSVIGKDAPGVSYPAGIYNFLDLVNQTPVALPTGFVTFHLVVPAFGQYTNISGFALNPQGNVAYLADLAWGVQKYVKTAGVWQFACNYNVQGFEQSASKTVITNDVKNSFGGCFDVAVDFSGGTNVIYATTADYSIYSGNVNSNRVVKIMDTNAAITGLTYTNFTVVAQATGTNISFRSIDFVPDLLPVISSVPVNQSVVTNTPLTFGVTASQSALAATYTTISYQWLQNGSPLSAQTNSSLNLAPGLSFVGITNYFQCVVSNKFGAVTSAPPAQLTVTTAPVPPYNLGALQKITNAIGDNVSITASAGGTTPLSYQWYVGNPAAGGAALADANEFGGTATGTLQIGNAQKGLDDTNYYCVVTNIAGSTNIFVATVKLVYTPPIISTPPASITVISNTPASFSAQGYGSGLNYQWYSNNIAISGATGTTLTINPAIRNANVTVVVTNYGGSVTSAVATLTVFAAPPHSFVNYTNAGQVYLQTFDSLPVATNSTDNTANPVLIWQVGSGSQVTYSVDNPFDFAYPVIATGPGGLGLTNAMPGWYGAGQLATKLGAHQGDQSTGGIIDYGTLSADGVTGSTNRALGLQSTSTTGNSAFGVKLVNNGTNALAYVTLNYVGELWRNQPNGNTLEFGYYVDSNPTNAFAPTNALNNPVPSLFVSFTPSVSLTVLDGSQATNQISLAVTNLGIGSWPTNTALWLVWQQTNSAGSAQGLAIDNLSFSASATLPATVIAPVSISAGSAHVTGSGASRVASFSFTNATGLSFSVLGTNNITAPKATWPVIGTATESPAGSGNYQFTDPNPATNAARYYLLRQP